MNKGKKKKLVLAKETLREPAGADLQAVGGGQEVAIRTIPCTYVFSSED